jgi:hypothetical protein
MPHVTVHLKKGEVRDFTWARDMKLEPGWVTVTDTNGKRVIFPAEEVVSIEETPERRF